MICFGHKVLHSPLLHPIEFFTIRKFYRSAKFYRSQKGFPSFISGRTLKRSLQFVSTIIPILKYGSIFFLHFVINILQNQKQYRVKFYRSAQISYREKLN